MLFFILVEAKETIFDFLQGTSIANSFCFDIISIQNDSIQRFKCRII